MTIRLLGVTSLLCIGLMSSTAFCFDAPGAGAGVSPVVAAAESGVGGLSEKILSASDLSQLLLTSGQIHGDAWAVDLATATNQRAEIAALSTLRSDIVNAITGVGGALQAKQDGGSTELAELLRRQTADILTGLSKVSVHLAGAVEAQSHDPTNTKSDCLSLGVALAGANASDESATKVQASTAFRRSYHADALYANYEQAQAALQQHLLFDPTMKNEAAFRSEWLFPGSGTANEIERVHLMVSVLSNPHQQPALAKAVEKTPAGQRAAAEMKVKSAYTAVAEGLLDSIATGQRQALQSFELIVPELIEESSSSIKASGTGYSREEYYLALQKYFAGNANFIKQVNAEGMGDLLRDLVRLQIASFSLNVDMYRNLNNLVVGIGTLVGQHTEEQNVRIASLISPLRAESR